jgi:LacI family repressor for deo operon, udp, cdd, tsx, nupC, and nupG
MKRPSTIKQVAERANVSIATISRALQNPAVVAPETRDRVMAAVAELNYVPNVQARSLRTSRSRVILALVPDITNPFFGEIIRGIERGAFETGYSVLLGDTQHDEAREASYASMIASGQVDGLLTMMPHVPELYYRQRFPIVTVCEYVADSSISRVRTDNPAGIALAVRHLAELGHRQIAYIGGRPDQPISDEREQGFRSTMRQLGLPVSPALMAVGNFTAESGARAAKELLDGGEPFTAICCASDETAVGAMQTLRNHGLKVPNDVSVVGFDDIPLSQYLDPPLTTVRQPTDRLGFEAVSILLEQLRNPKFEPRMLVLPTEMMVRGSTAPPRN